MDTYLARLEAGEQRVGFLTALARHLVTYYETLEPGHYARFAAVVIEVAENPDAFHRSRLRAVQAVPRVFQGATKLLARLASDGDDGRWNHLEQLLSAFCQQLPPESIARLAGVLRELAGPAAKSTSDVLRAIQASLKGAREALAMQAELQALQRHYQPAYDANDPQMRLRMEAAERELAQIDREIEAELEEEKRLDGAVRLDGRGQNTPARRRPRVSPSINPPVP